MKSDEQLHALSDEEAVLLRRHVVQAVERRRLAAARADKMTEIATANQHGGGETRIEMSRDRRDVINGLLNDIDGDLRKLTQGLLDIYGVTAAEVIERRLDVKGVGDADDQGSS